MFKFNFVPADKENEKKIEIDEEIVFEPMKFHKLEPCSKFHSSKTGKTENFERIGQLQYFLDTDTKSDLEGGIYEGGNVVWECTLDLMRYLDQSIESFDGKSGKIFESKNLLLDRQSGFVSCLQRVAIIYFWLIIIWVRKLRRITKMVVLIRVGKSAVFLNYDQF